MTAATLAESQSPQGQGGEGHLPTRHHATGCQLLTSLDCRLPAVLRVPGLLIPTFLQGLANLARRGLVAGPAVPAGGMLRVLPRRLLEAGAVLGDGTDEGRAPAAAEPEGLGTVVGGGCLTGEVSWTAGGLVEAAGDQGWVAVAGGEQEEEEEEAREGEEAVQPDEMLSGYERLPSRSVLLAGAAEESAEGAAEEAAEASGGAAAPEAGVAGRGAGAAGVAAKGLEAAVVTEGEEGEMLEPLLEEGVAASDAGSGGSERGAGSAEAAAAPEGGQPGRGAAAATTAVPSAAAGGLLPTEVVGGEPEHPAPAPRHRRGPSEGSVASVDELLEGGEPPVEGEGAAVSPPTSPSAPPLPSLAPATPAQPPPLGPAAAAGFTSPLALALGGHLEGAPAGGAVPGATGSEGSGYAVEAAVPAAEAGGMQEGAFIGTGVRAGLSRPSPTPLMAFLVGVAADEAAAAATAAGAPEAAPLHPQAPHSQQEARAADAGPAPVTGWPADRANTAFSKELAAAAAEVVSSQG